MPCSERQLAANRVNAKRSTGPKTKAGKRASSQNALKHGLTGRKFNLAQYLNSADVIREAANLWKATPPKTEVDLLLLVLIATKKALCRNFAALDEILFDEAFAHGTVGLQSAAKASILSMRLHDELFDLLEIYDERNRRTRGQPATNPKISNLLCAATKNFLTTNPRATRAGFVKALKPVSKSA